ncbi:hypothetical protein HPB47_014784 [Ixodes persulcatus]|uniref:Uncharacterized protein n=1 Tax=Ixodes persulcatus TaxID=34615 RepID=A0AC60QXN9_IXOPE|nr:hypothetical protein HPB47_014784 [Ixodes persulcatus]
MRKWGRLLSELPISPISLTGGPCCSKSPSLHIEHLSCVACWHAPSGCSFVGPAASLLDHYKECDFNVVPCCLCHSSVLRSNILEHFKSDCSIHQATSEPTNTPATQDFKDVSRACLKMKTAIGKISEDLMSLQTSLNQCREDVRVEVLFLYIGVHGTFYDYFSYSYVLLFMKALVCIFKLNLN